MKGKKTLIWGICLWIGGSLLSVIFRMFSEMTRSTSAGLILSLLSLLLVIATITGFVMVIIGIVKLIRERNPKFAKNVKLARKV